MKHISSEVSGDASAASPTAASPAAASASVTDAGTHDILRVAEDLAGLCADRADVAERERTLPAEVSDALRDAGVFRLCVPRRHGGLEASPETVFRVVESLARGDGSAGWCAAIAATSGLLAGYLPASHAAEIYGSPDSVSGGVFAPKGKAEPDGDGFRISGRWSFASGSAHCTYLMGGCVVLRDGKPAPMPDGSIDARLFLFPATEAEIIDTWSVSGLCGTGSNDIAVKDLHVPAERSVSLVHDRPVEQGPLYTFPVFSLLALGIAGVACGLARRSIYELVELAGAKTPTGARRPLAMKSSTQAAVAVAEADLAAARCLLLDRVGEAYELAAAGSSTDGRMSVQQRAGLRLAATHAVRASARVVDAMYECGGGTSIYRASALQRCFRDVHTATQHLMVSPATYESVGRIYLGVEADSALL